MNLYTLKKKMISSFIWGFLWWYSCGNLFEFRENTIYTHWFNVYFVVIYFLLLFFLLIVLSFFRWSKDQMERVYVKSVLRCTSIVPRRSDHQGIRNSQGNLFLTEIGKKYSIFFVIFCTQIRSCIRFFKHFWIDVWDLQNYFSVTLCTHFYFIVKISIFNTVV